MIQHGDLATSFDHLDVYFHLLVHRRDKKSRSGELRMQKLRLFFLIVLTLSRQSGEIHTLTLSQSVVLRGIQHWRQTATPLRFLPEFLAKNQQPNSLFPTIFIHPLTWA